MPREEVALLMQPTTTCDDPIEAICARPAWHARAACRGVGTEVFFPADQLTFTRARQICAGCEVRAECLEFALEHPSLKGIWAGLSERARARARQGRPAGDEPSADEGGPQVTTAVHRLHPEPCERLAR